MLRQIVIRALSSEATKNGEGGNVVPITAPGGEQKSGHEEHSEEDILCTVLVLFTLILILGLGLAHYVSHKWHIKFMPEAAVILMVGLILGSITAATKVHDHAESLLSFSPVVFFIFFLPPIILKGAYEMRQEFFFTELGPILAFAIGGTIISNIIVAAILLGIQQAVNDSEFHMEFTELLAFGGLISATDPVSTLAVFTELKVHPTLFYIVSGESIINDAVGVVLFSTFSSFVGKELNSAGLMAAVGEFIAILLGSTCLGYGLGVFTAFVFSKVCFKENLIMEVSIYCLCAYIPFVLAELAHMSGIVTIMASGMTMRRYAHHNLSSDVARETCYQAFSVAALLTESAVFVNLGMTVFNFQEKVYRWWFIGAAIFACLVGRVVAVFGLSAVINLNRHLTKTGCKLLSGNMQFMLWFAGLRGAVAFACACDFPNTYGNRNDMIAATMMIVLFTVFVMGTFTLPMLKCLKIDIGVDLDNFEQPEVRNMIARWMLGLERLWIYPLVVRKKVKPVDHQVPDSFDPEYIDPNYVKSERKKYRMDVHPFLRTEDVVLELCELPDQAPRGPSRNVSTSSNNTHSGSPNQTQDGEELTAPTSPPQHNQSQPARTSPRNENFVITDDDTDANNDEEEEKIKYV